MRGKILCLLPLGVMAAAVAGAQPATPRELRERLTAELRADPALRVPAAVARAASTALDGPALLTVTVDCTRPNASINAALARKAQELVVEIRGVCVENVVVERDRVTLRGADPAVDGIQAAGNGDPFEAALLIRHARRVRVENLRLTGAFWNGLRALNARGAIEVHDCVLTGNGQRGADVVDSSVAFDNVTVTGNGTNPPGIVRGGLVFASGARGSCSGCTIGGNPAPGENFGLIAFHASEVTVIGSSVEAAQAIVAQLHSSIGLDDASTVTAAGFAIQANFHASALIRETTITGALGGFEHSALRLLGSSQLAAPFPNFFEDDASFESNQTNVADPGDPPVIVPSSVAVETFVIGFATAQIEGNSTVAELTCLQAGEVFCDGTETKGTVTGCTKCP